MEINVTMPTLRTTRSDGLRVNIECPNLLKEEICINTNYSNVILDNHNRYAPS